ncbi:hypothetical protein CPB83DRAFT_467138 [Crepidotus variabilis]|uniref:Uncharacterized protein n=1 Tax=Crepidotus variabilis TaxID=179855 RepID=A0A9P6EBJ6_9AGAR|nr:hypothetical protein CPB83DRAFT_467138 [Crepidotus variabilis]
MSLDDPAVIAGIANDGQPFFSESEQTHDGLLTTDVGPDLDTPMPLKRGAGQLHMPAAQRPSTATGVPSNSFAALGAGGLPTPSRELDTKELKDFWKEYMRTPLTGPHDPLAGGSNGSPTKTVSSPAGYRRQRVSSLPSAKTPMVEKPSFMQGQYGHVDPRARDAGVTSSMRTTLHGKEDLRSYEAAVMARKAPAIMNLQLKRPGKLKPGQPQQSHSEANASETHSASASPQMGYGSRPSSSSGQDHSLKHHASTSSLANAFGERLSYNPHDESPPSLTNSRDTSVDSDTASDAELRPSFKRLPSQTLGPDNAKRAFLGYEDDLDDRERSAGWMTGAPKVLNPGAISGMSHPDRVVASIAERRRRRMSAPGGSPPDVVGRLVAPMPSRSHNQTPDVSTQGGMAN